VLPIRPAGSRGDVTAPDFEMPEGRTSRALLEKSHVKERTDSRSLTASNNFDATAMTCTAGGLPGVVTVTGGSYHSSDSSAAGMRYELR
jgi:hypothetical protein